MVKNCNKNKIFSDFLSGIYGAMLLSAYSLCFCAVTGINITVGLFCIAICALFSVKSENKLFCPDVFLLMPVLFVVLSGTGKLLPISILCGTIFCCIFEKAFKSISIPDCVIGGAGLGLALLATILLTNNYFGIGANGATAFDMLKSYRSLGFHPHFMGLLYGTITLFTMITYPFKFRKLNKYIPAEFITLLIPLILNLFLNPQPELTTINEAAFEKITLTDLSVFNRLSSVTSAEISVAIKGSFVLGLILCFYKNKKESSFSFYGSNALSGVLCGFPVRPFEVKSYSFISALVTIILSCAVIILCPGIISRLPMHSIGALLIVSTWQKAPYKYVASAFKSKKAIHILIAIFIIVSFVVLDIFSACLLCLGSAFLLRRAKK